MKIRIAVAVHDESGEWSAFGHSANNKNETAGTAVDCLSVVCDRIVWVEAEIPPTQIIVGEVKS